MGPGPKRTGSAPKEECRMTLYELIRQISWQNVEKVFFKEYPDLVSSMPAWRDAFEVLLLLEPRDPGEKVMRICIVPCTDECDPNRTWHRVYGKDGTLCSKKEGYPPERRMDEVEWGFDWMPWSKWPSMEIDVETLKTYTPEEIAAHVIWEMTWWGFDKKALKKAKKKDPKLIAGIRKLIAENKEARTDD